MPKEHFDKIDAYVERARRSKSEKTKAIQGLRLLHKTYTESLRALDAHLRKFDRNPPFKGFEREWTQTHERLLAEHRRQTRLLKKIGVWLKTIRTSINVDTTS
jgi:hypothetical protein